MKTSLYALLGLLAGALLFAGCPPTGDDDDSTVAAADDDDDDDDDSAPADDDDAVPGPLELIGSYLDGWGSFHVVTAETWHTGLAPTDSVYLISQYDNDAGWVVAQNGEDNAFFPEAWSRFDWTTVDGQLYFCTTAYDAGTEQAALDADAPDATDPSASGCCGFSWTAMNADQGPLAVNGIYNDGWGTFHAVLQDVWHQGGLNVNRYTLSQYDNDAGYAIAENHADNEFSGGLWSRFDFTSADGAWWYCQSAYDAADEAAALATVAADPADPANAGCGGFSWTSLGADEGFTSLRGTFDDEWGTVHTVTWDQWDQDTNEYFLTIWDTQWAVARNGDSNAFNPGLWSKLHWTTFDDATYYCQTAFDATDVATALAAPDPDYDDLGGAGCGGFAWTNLTP